MVRLLVDRAVRALRAVLPVVRPCLELPLQMFLISLRLMLNRWSGSGRYSVRLTIRRCERSSMLPSLRLPKGRR